MSLQDRKPVETAGSATPLWMGLAAALVLFCTALAGSHLGPGAMTAAPAAMAPAAMAPAAMAPAAMAPAAMAPAAMAPAATPATAVATAAPAMAPAAATAMAPVAATAADATKMPVVATDATKPVAMDAPKPDVNVDDLMAPGALPENVLGDPKAAVTIVEYASMTCPHCADFHQHTFPELKTKYIDTGKVKLVFREFPLDNLAAAVSELARCLGPVRYFAFVGTMFDRQAEWHTGDQDLPKVQEMAKQAGFTDDSFKSCVTDQKLLDNIKAVRTRADEKFGVNSTPTFFVNGVKMKGEHDIKSFDAALAPFLK